MPVKSLAEYYGAPKHPPRRDLSARYADAESEYSSPQHMASIFASRISEFPSRFTKTDIVKKFMIQGEKDLSFVGRALQRLKQGGLIGHDYAGPKWRNLT